MAKDKETAPAEKAAPTPPAGFRRLVEASSAPWFTSKEGNLCFGKLHGRYIMQVEPPRPYYQVELYQACTVTVGKGEEAEEIQAEAGDIINVGESFKLQCLKEVVVPELLAGAEYDVWIESQKKINVGKGRSMWQVDVQAKCRKKPTSQPRPLHAEAGMGSEETPF